MTDSKQSKSPKDGQSPDRQSDNLWVWNAGAQVPKTATKEFNNGRFKGTDINRMWRIQVLTGLFGPAGVGWDWKLVDTQTYQLDGDGRVVIFARGELRLYDFDKKMWSEPIIGYGGNDLVQSNARGIRINDDAYKMVDTDAFGHACSKLGIGASVYWNEATKYTSTKAEDEPTQGFVPKEVIVIQQAKKNAVPVKQTADKKPSKASMFFMSAAEKAAQEKEDERKATKTELVHTVQTLLQDDTVGTMAQIRLQETLDEYGLKRLEDLNTERLRDLINEIMEVM